MVAKSKLQKFQEKNPYADLLIIRKPSDFPSQHEEKFGGPVEIRASVPLRTIASYSRRRDAYRALKRLGYEQEGVYWRHVTVKDREPA